MARGGALNVNRHHARHPMQWRMLVLWVVATLLAGCTGSTVVAGKPSPRPSASAPCRPVCTGSIGGAEYAIRVPANWNGTLLLYSHGYGSHRATPRLSQSDVSGRGEDAVSASLLRRGYALAASAYPGNGGWVVAQAVESDVALYRRFVRLVAKPSRTYAWGSSMGGLVTELLAERYPWVDGAAPMCGVVGGPVRNFDNLLDAILATQSLLGVDLTAQLFTDTGKAQADAVARAAITHALADPSSRNATKVLYLARLLGVPIEGVEYPTSRIAVTSAGASLRDYDSFAVAAFAELVRRFGGNPAEGGGSLIVDRPTVHAADAAVLARHLDPAPFRHAVARTPRIRAVARARSALLASGNPTGRLQVPTLTMHTIFDPIVLVANERVLADRVEAAGRSDLLEQTYIAPPKTNGATPYGMGHCRFSAGQEIGLITALDGWVRSGLRPSPATLRTDLGPGYDPAFQAPAWPAGGR